MSMEDVRGEDMEWVIKSIYRNEVGGRRSEPLARFMSLALRMSLDCTTVQLLYHRPCRSRVR